MFHRWPILATVALFIILLSFQGAAAATAKVKEMAFGIGTQELGASSFKLLGKSSRFPTSVGEIWCFVKLATYSKILSATFEWYTPGGDLYHSEEVGTLDAGYIWSLRSAIHISGYAAALHPGTWTVKLKLIPGRDATARFNLYAVPGGSSPAPAASSTSPVSPSPLPPSGGGGTVGTNAWKVDDYTLNVVDSIKTAYSSGAAHVTLIVARPDGQGWTIVDDVKVDTGAAETMLPLEVAQALGIDLKAGREIDLSGGTGANVGWEHKLRMGIIFLGGGGDGDGYVLGKNGKPFLFTVPIIFSGKEANNTSYKLLGRTGVLSYLNLLFGEHMLTIMVRPE